MQSIFKELGYTFPHTMLLDVEQCVPVAVENPLPKPFAIPTFWVPNVILSCDFLITIAPFKVMAGRGLFSIWNLLGLLPAAKYRQEVKAFDVMTQHPDIDEIAADLYFTLPFDMGIVDGRKKLNCTDDPLHGNIEDYGKILVGSPYEVDYEASQAEGLMTKYIRLIDEVKEEKEKSNNDN